MPLAVTLPAARSPRLPDGVTIQPRRFDFEGLDQVPPYWLGDNPLLTHTENAFSLLIPPGERFFIQSVQHYADRATDPELRELIRAFVQQEALHTRAHNDFNASLARFGVDVEREVAYADRVVARMQRWLPRKMQLGVTVFLEHLTATGAHMLFLEPAIARAMHPEMLRFWRWHAVEELEHKAVAFDLFREVGGSYALRVASALTAALFLALPFVKIVRRMLRDDPNPVTDAMREQARELNRKAMRPQLRMLRDYFRHDFHPWQCRDESYLAAWYVSPEAPGGYGETA